MIRYWPVLVLMIAGASIAGNATQLSAPPSVAASRLAERTNKIFPVIASGALAIHVIYLQTVDRRPNGMPDVWEADVATGARRLVLAHDKWPVGFATKPECISVSPSGKHLAVQELRSALDEAGRGVWLLDRPSGRVKRVFVDSYWQELGWSPNGRFLWTIHDDGIGIYDVNAAKVRHFTNPGWAPVVWSGDGQSLLLDRKMRSGYGLYAQPADGRPARQLLARDPMGLQFVQSPAKSGGFADFDGKKVHLFNARGHRLHTWKIPDPYLDTGDTYHAALAYNHSGTRLAVLTRLDWGEPHINIEWQLWSVDVTRMKAVRVAAWDDTAVVYPGEESLDWSLEGWSPDGVEILVSAKVSWGGDGPSAERNDRYCLWSINTTQYRPKEKLIFDSGPGCYGLTWW